MIKLKNPNNEELLKMINEAEFIGLDLETAAENFDVETEAVLRLENLRFEKGYLTKADYKTVYKGLEDERKQKALSPKNGFIRLLLLNIDNKYLIIVDSYKYEKNKFKSFFKALQTKNLIGHNIKFDLKYIVELIPDFCNENIFDTMLNYQLCKYYKTSNRFPKDLGTVIKDVLNIEIPKDEGGSDWSKAELTQNQIDYAFNDVKYLLDVARKEILFLNKINTKSKPDNFGCTNVISQLENKFIWALVFAELEGITINKDFIKNHYKEINEKKEQLKETIFNDYNVNPHSPKQIKEYLLRKGIETKSTNISSLKELVDMAPEEEKEFISLLLQYSTIKTSSTLGENFIKLANKENKIFPNFIQISSPTGRMTATKPNVCQIPRPIKEGFYKDEIIKADYPAIEARIMAIIANDKIMIQNFVKNEDIHKTTTRAILHKNEVTKEERQIGKSANFGLLYGMGANAYKSYCKNNFGFEITNDEAQEVIKKFFELYKGVKSYQNKNSDLLFKNKSIVTETKWGRKMETPFYTNANNFPIQGTGADIFKLACLLFYKKINKENAVIINFVHDELIVKIKNKNKLNEIKTALKGAMSEAFIKVLQPPFKIDIEVEQNF